jgi:hypothetical protein
MLVVVSLLAYNLCRQLKPLPTLVSHFGTEYPVKLLYRQTKKAQSERSENTRKIKELTKRLEYHPQTRKSTRHRNCRAKDLPRMTIWFRHCQLKTYRVS